MKKLGFWTLIVALAAVAGGTLSYKPWKAFFEQRSIANEQRKEMDDAEKNRGALAREKAALESHSGREALAREHGFIRPGERPVESP